MTITQSFLTSEISNLWPDNSTGVITPANARTTLNDMVTAIFQGIAPLGLSTSNTWTGLQLFNGGATVLGIADLRQFGATAGVNCQPAVALAVAAGYEHVFMPANFFYQGGGTGAQAGATEIPANLEIIGENQQTSIVKAVDRTNSSTPGFIYLNNFSVLTNCGTQSYPGDQQTSPSATQKTVMQPRVSNLGNAKSTWVPWTGATIILSGANITSPEGVISTDNPSLQVVQSSLGDGLFSQTTGGGIAARLQTGGSADTALLVQNGVANPTNIHTGIHIIESGTNASSASLALERANGSTAILNTLADDGPGTATTAWNQWVVQFQTSGIIRNIFQATTPFSGYFDNINAGNSGGTFTGFFVNYTIANSPVYQVQFDGSVGIGTSVLSSSFISITAGTTAKSQFNLASSAAPTSPNNNDVWWDGTNLNFRVAGVTKKLTPA